MELIKRSPLRIVTRKSQKIKWPYYMGSSFFCNRHNFDANKVVFYIMAILTKIDLVE